MDKRSAAVHDSIPSGEYQIFSTSLVIEPEDYSPLVSANRWVSFQYAVAGWVYMLRTQKNIRIQAVATIVVVMLGLWLGLAPLEWAVLVVVIAMEWMAEFINGAIEAAVNVASPELHPMAKISKDVAAAAVLLAAVAAIIVGLLILGPPLWSRLHELGIL